MNANSSASSSEGTLTSLRLDLPLHRKNAPARPKSAQDEPNSNQRHHNSVDAFLSHLGDPGRFQVVIMILLATNCIPVVVNHLLMAFYAVKTPHNCRVSLGNL